MATTSMTMRMPWGRAAAFTAATCAGTTSVVSLLCENASASLDLQGWGLWKPGFAWLWGRSYGMTECAGGNKIVLLGWAL